MRTSSIADGLFSKTRQAILAATFLEPRKWWYMRELARHLRVPASSLQRELDSLVRHGILRKRHEGRHVYFQAETDSPIFGELRCLILKTTGLADVIRKALAGFRDRIQWAFIYGSVARAEEYATSDVDLMIIGDLGLAAVSPAIRKAEQKLNRAVNPTIYTAAEFMSKLKAGQHFVNAVLKSKKIFVLGAPREFDAAFSKQTHSAA